MQLDLSNILLALAKKHNAINFEYLGEPLPLEQVFAKNGGLPLITKKASALYDFLFGEPLKVSYTPDANALTGETLVVLDNQHLFVLLMILYDTIEEMSASAGKGPIKL